MGSIKMFIRNKKAAWQQVEENIIIVTSQTRKMHILDGIGQRIWHLLESPVSRDDIVNTLESEYEESREIIEKDLDDFINRLIELSVVEIVSE
jgi:hypothetical protein